MAAAPNTTTVSPTPQFRGLWVNAWGQGFRSPAEVDRLIEAAKTARINALLVQVRKRGDAYYRSGIEPSAADIAPGFDALEYLLTKAKPAGIEIHAWVVMYPAWSDRLRPPPPGHVLDLYPDWATVNVNGIAMKPRHSGEGVFLDPGLPEVQAYLSGVVRDLVSRYAVDGVHLDYVRYPGTGWGYHPRAVQRFTRETGHTPRGAPSAWDRWRRDQVTHLVERIAREIDEIRPSTRLSAAVFPNRAESFVKRLQDWESWTAKGLVDFVAPMNYATQRSLFISRTTALLSRGVARPVYMGVGGGNKSEAALINQIQLLLRRGVAGIILYHYEGNSPGFWKTLGSRVFRRPAPPPILPWKPKTAFIPPAATPR